MIGQTSTENISISEQQIDIQKKMTMEVTYMSCIWQSYIGTRLSIFYGNGLITI